MMDGLYLYCIRDKSVGDDIFSIKGIDGNGDVFTLSYDEFETVVSSVSLQEFESEAIQIKAQEDLNWIKEKAVIHERVIEQAMMKEGKNMGLIPMGFGTIFKEEASLRESLNKNHDKIKHLLDIIRGKQEWGVKVYLNDKKFFEKNIKEKSELIKEKEREMASLPEGMAFFMEEELKEIIDKEKDKELNNITGFLFEILKKHAVDSVRNKLLEKELTGIRKPMVLNAAYLISDGKVEEFINEAERLKQKVQTEGFCLEYSGPWPAYNFTKFQ